MSNTDRPNFLDAILDGADSLIGKMEDSKRFSEPAPKDEEEIEDAVVVSIKTSKPKLIWGFVNPTKSYHLFESFTPNSVCGRIYELSDVKERTTEINGESKIFCCTCVRILHSKYQNS